MPNLASSSLNGGQATVFHKEDMKQQGNHKTRIMKSNQSSLNRISRITGIAAAFMMAGVANALEPIVPIKTIPQKSVFKNSAFNKPIVLKSKEEATKHFGKEAVATLGKAVDFKKQFVLVFAWRGSGGDQLNYTVAESFPEQITFSRQFGRTRDLRSHAKVFALRSNVKWSVKGRR